MLAKKPNDFPYEVESRKRISRFNYELLLSAEGIEVPPDQKQKYVVRYFENKHRETIFPGKPVVREYKDEKFVDHLTHPDVRIHISKEHRITNTVHDKPTSETTVTRHVWRISDEITLYVSKRETTGGPAQTKTTYDIEIEKIFTTNWKDYPAFKAFVSAWHLYYDNDSSIRSVLAVMKPGHTNNDTLPSDVIAKPRNIRRKDFSSIKVSDGKYAGPPFDNNYNITYKCDGEQRCLAITKNGIWWIKGSSPQIVPISRSFIFQDGRPSADYLVVGEYMDAGLFVPFDFLVDSDERIGENDDYSHTTRMEILRKSRLESIVECLSDVKFFYKEFINVGTTPESFGAAYERILSSVKFKIDGAILTPNNVRHVSGNHLSRDNITTNKVICKIKSIKDMTIDIIFKDSRVWVSSGAQLSPFADLSHVKEIHGLPDGHEPDQILEVAFFVPSSLDRSQDDVDDDDDIQDSTDVCLRFTRYRPDKDYPNSTNIARNALKDFLYPISKSFFDGTGLVRMFQYSNVIKTRLINSINIPSIVVDIGSGRGGDLMKYIYQKSSEGANCIKSLIAIEPDDHNRSEFVKRIKSISKKVPVDSISILDCGGEDTARIVEKVREVQDKTPGCPIVVCAMLSMSFFWKDADFLRKFKRTLVSLAKLNRTNTKTRFLFYTIDGQRTLSVLSRSKEIKTENIEMSLDDSSPSGVSLKGKVDIRIKDSIVRGQEEYLVNIDDISDVVTIRNILPANEETFMTEEEKMYQSMFVYADAEIESELPLFAEKSTKTTFFSGKLVDPSIMSKPDSMKMVTVLGPSHDSRSVQVIHDGKRGKLGSKLYWLDEIGLQEVTAGRR